MAFRYLNSADGNATVADGAAMLAALRPDALTRDRRAIARRLRCLRQAHMAMLDDGDASVEAFAALVGLPADAVRSYEGAMTDPPVQHLILLHRATGASLDWLLTGADEM